MGLNKHHVVPVDTHVFQITSKLYADKIKLLNSQKQKKSLSKQVHNEIGKKKKIFIVNLIIKLFKDSSM